MTAVDHWTMADPRYVIWSIEHDAWWRPGWAGYTPVLAEAGRYDQAEATAILARANFVRVNECAIPVACVETARDDDARIAQVRRVRAMEAEYGPLLEAWLADPATAAAAIPTASPRASFTCPRCGRTSHHPMDAQERYCGACHQFFPEA